ncbi:MAG: carboxymuconolactone decarboxylase family protein [Lamprobacter sp.]|uniref:carboxymuconolactone decarboxylase family protein n=1 Tax=Lamprobacter sp. TaxID=3100796 RepID=UPI002B256956|nr:carboxymuconolactone decarboxylase family protein [Lamprobacter sp.]MEA3642414.1 carboxymuconolactone decarboxylase family protein [Lamprobacter sp.]
MPSLIPDPDVQAELPDALPAKPAMPALSEAERRFSQLPRPLRTLEAAPASLQGYLALGAWLEKTSLSSEEQQVVLLSVSRESRCAVCMGAHGLLTDMMELPPAMTEALRAGSRLPDQRLESLRQFTAALAKAHGHIDEAAVAALEQAGYDRQQVLEVILGIGMKTLAHFSDQIPGTDGQPLPAACLAC